MKKPIITYPILLFMLTVISGLFSCNKQQATEARAPYVIPDSLMKTLAVDTVKSSNITDAIKFNGLVDFNTDKVVNVFPLVTGNVQGVSVVPGDYVRAGQVLGVVKSAEVANYNSALITATTNMQLTAKQLAQQKDLFKSGLASQVDITNAQVAYEQAVATRTAAEKILSINGNNTNGEYLIKAPIDGFIVQMNIANGMAIRTDNNSGLFTISDLKNVWVQANIYEGSIGKVHQGDSVKVTTIAYPDKVFKGGVDKIMDALDPVSKTLKMRIVMPNPGYLLKPQMFATVTLDNIENKTAISVSAKALVFDNSQYYVVVLDKKNNVQIRPVQLISNNGTTAYVQSGLSPGERVIASNAILIYGELNN